MTAGHLKCAECNCKMQFTGTDTISKQSVETAYHPASDVCSYNDTKVYMWGGVQRHDVDDIQEAMEVLGE